MNDVDYSIYYSRFHDDTEEHAEKMAAWIKSMLEPNLPAERISPVLDIGCGYGFALRALRHLGFKQVKGLEISPQQAERCRKAGFEVAVTDDTIHWLKENAGQFAFVVLLDVLEHIPVEDQIQFARAIFEVLKPEGKVFLTVPNANAILSARYRYNDYTHRCSFTEHSLYFVLRNAGFKTIEIENEKGIGRFPRRLWRRSAWPAARKWIIRWCWLQVHKAELPWERLDQISFELNLKAVATKP
jgi:SAM-dependent methyltransferase